MPFRAFAGWVAIIAACALSSCVLAAETPSPEIRASNDLLDLFSQACMKNLGRPEGVRAWAADHQLTRVQTSEAVQAYAGAGDGGMVWTAPAPSGLFVLAIRASSQACAVYAEKADPETVETYIGRLMEALKQAGRPVAVLKDDKTPTPIGRRHGLMYSVGGGSWPTLEVFTVITDDRSDGPYQATIQVVAKARDAPQGGRRREVQ